MLGARGWILVVSTSVLCVSASPAETQSQSQNQSQAQSKPSHPKHKGRKPTPPQLVLPPLSNNPLPQMPMDLLPAAPPKVGFQGGLLTIVSENSTLADILREVHKLTGAVIDIPANANERVVTRLGPGAPRDVLATLLNGSSFNYVMLGSDSNPSAVSSIVLTAKSASNPTPGAGNQPTQAYVPPQQPQPFVAQQVVPQPAGVQMPQPGQDDNANGDDPDASSDENADQDQGQTDANGAAPPDQQQQPQPPQPNAGPKTPEQILDMLRRQQQPPGTANPQQPPEN